MTASPVSTFLGKLAAMPVVHGHSRTVAAPATALKRLTDTTGNGGTPFRYGRKLTPRKELPAATDTPPASTGAPWQGTPENI